MKTFFTKKLVLTALLLSLFSLTNFAANYFSVASGNWTSPSTWSNSDLGAPLTTGFPVAGDVVTITRGFTVTINANVACATINPTTNGQAGISTLLFGGAFTLTVSGNIVLGGTSFNTRDNAITFVNGSTLDVAGSITLGGVNPSPGQGIITMVAGSTLKAGSLIVGNGSGTWTPGTGTVQLTANNTLPSTVFTSFNNLTINSGTTTTSGVSFSTTGTLTVNGILTPGATSHVFSGAGTLNGSGRVDVTLISATAFSTQYSMTTRTISGMTVNYNGAGNQTIQALAYNNISFVSSGTKTVTNAGLSIAGSLTVGTGTTLLLNSDITLKSTASKTAEVAAVAGTISYGTGKFVIERYIQARRAWRFLSAPVTAASAPTINAAWQEGVTTASGNSNPFPGFGTHITGGNFTGLGFDQNPSGSYSTKESLASNAWSNITNTATAKVTDQKGYMVFVRGSRANNLSQGAAAVADATTLRVSGQLNVGNQTFSNSTAGFFPVSNPYASAINIPTLWGTSNNVPMIYSVWDPLLTGTNSVGAFVQYSWNGSSWTKSVTPASPLVDGKVESGSAFLVQWNSSNTLTLTESNKTSGSVLAQTPTTAPGEESRITLNRVNADGTVSTQDGMVVEYNSAFSNAMDMYDAEKVNNFSQNLSSLRNGTKYAIERRDIIGNNDSIFISINQMTAGNYQLDIINNALNHPGLIGQLKDNYLNTLTNLDLNGTTTVPFTVDANAGSYAADRFAVYFGIPAPLPVNYSTVKAYRRANDNAVEWKVENEINIKQYEVERANDGIAFINIATVLPTGNANSSVNYLQADIAPLNGDNFYRIKAISINGRIQYSPVVRVAGYKTNKDIAVYPNPVKGNTINIRYSQQVAGNYQARLYSNDGTLIYSGNIQLANNGTEAIILGNKPAAGTYQLELKNDTESILKQTVIIL